MEAAAALIGLIFWGIIITAIYHAAKAGAKNGVAEAKERKD